MPRAVLSILLLLSSIAAHGAATLQDDLRELYASYNAALAAKDGPKAASCLHSRILASYGEAHALALKATRAELTDVSPHKKLIALYIRAAATPDDLDRMKGPGDVVAFMVQKGALRSEPQASIDLREFSTEGEQVFASLYSNGRNTHLRLRFEKEAGAWKVDLGGLDAMADDVYTQSARMQGVSVDESLLRLVQQSIGRPVADTIWTPLR